MDPRISIWIQRGSWESSMDLCTFVQILHKIDDAGIPVWMLEFQCGSWDFTVDIGITVLFLGLQCEFWCFISDSAFAFDSFPIIILIILADMVRM